MGEEDCLGPIVIDNGTLMLKAGFGGDYYPRAEFPNIVQRPKHKNVMIGMAHKDAYVGDEASCRRRGILKQCYAMKQGVVINWDDMEKIWHHTFYNELRINPEEHLVLLTENVLNPKLNRQKTAEIMFEQFNVPAMYLINTAVTSLYTTGKSTGIVLESASITQTVPIYEGYALRNNICTMEIGGDDMTAYLMMLLNKRGYAFTTTAEREIVRDIKEKLCYVAYDFDEELVEERNYELPDGQIITICKERIECFEAMFKPQMLGKGFDGIHTMIYESIMKCNDRLREMCGNIVLSGGNCLFGDFPPCHYSYISANRNKEDSIVPRLTKELRQLFCGKDDCIIDGYCREHYGGKLYNDVVDQVYKYSTPVIECKVVAPKNRKYSAWIGGSMLSVLSEFNEMCVNKNEYQDIGKKIINRKCF